MLTNTAFKRFNLSRRFYGTVNILSKQAEYEFMSKFRDSQHDDIKKKYPLLVRYAMECQINPNINKKKFELIRQIYSM